MGFGPGALEKVAGIVGWLDTYKGKKIFLTGHTGFKGSWLSQWLLHLGAEVVGYSKDIPTNPSLFETLGLSKNLQDLRGDIRDQAALEKALQEAKPDVVFHLAAQALVRPSYENPLDTFEENTMGTARVLEAVRRNGNIPALVVVTTDKVYENAGEDYAFRETDPLGGHDPYSASKAAAEIVFSSYARSFFQTGTRLCSARAGNVIGGGDWAKDRLVPDCIRSWSQGRPVEIRNSAHTRPWEHVLEPLGGYLLLGHRLLQQPERVHGEAFNFGPSGETDRNVLQLVTEMERFWPGSSHRVAAGAKDGRKEASALRLDCERAASRLRWAPRASFAETVEWTVSWYQRYFRAPVEMQEFTLSQIKAFEGRL